MYMDDLKYYGQFVPHVDEEIHKRYFNNTCNGVAIECGAFDGLIDSSCKFFEENYNWKTINIEPLPIAFNTLLKNRPNSINLNIALSNNNEDSVFTNYSHPLLGDEWGNGSISHTQKHKDELVELCGENNYTTTVVKCSTYKEIITKFNIEHLDLFVLDVEGHEFKVIEGMMDCDILPSVFVIEFGHTEIDELVDKLKCLNTKYKLDHVSFVNLYFIKENFESK